MLSRAERTVTVYAFDLIDEGPERPRRARFKAPMDVILREHRHAAVILQGTAEEVLASELDAEGRYRRIATGWGAL